MTSSRRALGSVLAALMLAGCSPATPSVQVARSTPQAEPVLIHDVAVVDVAELAVHRDMDVLLKGGRIAALGPAGTLSGAEGARRISGRGASLVPGLIDMHGHVESDTKASWNRGFPDAEANLRAYVYCGVTTVFDPHDPSEEAFERRGRIQRGELIGPQIYTTGPLLTVPGGHPIALVQELAPAWIAWYLAPRAATAVEGDAQIASAVDALAADGADAVKIVIDRIPLESARMSRETARAIVERARAKGLRVVAHIGTTEDAIDAAEAGVALWVHGVYKEAIPEAQVAKLAAFGIPMVTTSEVFDRYGRSGQGPLQPTRLERETVPAEVLDAFHPVPEDFDVGSLMSWLELAQQTSQVRSDNARRLRAAGVTILAGSDVQTGVFPGPSLHRELVNLVGSGMTPLEAIRAATLDSARWLSQADDPDFGWIAPGKRADLLLVDGDAGSDVKALEQIREVFLAGIPLERSALGAGER